MKETCSDTFGDRIGLLRTNAGESMTQLARAMNVTVSTVSKWESGDREPGLKMVDELSQHFGVTTDYLIKGDCASRDACKNCRAMKWLQATERFIEHDSIIFFN